MSKEQQQQLYDIDDLLSLMRALRDPEHGCPWDLLQTPATIVPFTIEEAYEVAEAIENGTHKDIISELGDLLFQVIFYCQLGAEAGHYEWQDVTHAIVDKLLRRHPHVFPDGTLSSAGQAKKNIDTEEVKGRWEAIKQEERSQSNRMGLLDDIPLALPALMRAYKLQKRAATVGFDWPNLEAVFAKLDEELEELQEAIDTQECKKSKASEEEISSSHIEEELGDVLFCCVNLARHLKLNPEQAMKKANQKFSARMKIMEAICEEHNQSLSKLSAKELEYLWQEAKKKLV